MKDKKLGRVIEFWELELEQVDESTGGLKKGKIVAQLIELTWVRLLDKVFI